MSRETIDLNERLLDYIRETTLREDAIKRELREETGEMEAAMMQISPEQGQFMRLLVELAGARRAIEIGTFTGYSAICIAEALGDDGELVACDVSEEWTEMAREYWERAGLEDRIELRLQPALETVDELLEAGEAGNFDFAFIDADKQNYVEYYERCLELLRPGGLMAVDNTLWSGAVADPDRDDPDTESIRELNEVMAGDERVSMSLVPIGDGVNLARKRP